MYLEPISNNIMFYFLDSTGGSKGKFTDRRTESGIIISTTDEGQKVPRWGKVVAVGPEAQVAVGDFILVEALQWSFNTEFEGEKLWKTDDTRVIMVTDDHMDTINTSFT
jgi:co-chaperonin GroES (HSP10)